MIKHPMKRIFSCGILTLVLSSSIVTAAGRTPTVSVENNQITNEIQTDDNIVVSEHTTDVVEATLEANIFLVKVEEVEVETFDNKGWTKTKVNIRKEPNTDSKILGTYKYNKKIKYSDYNNKWVKIKYKDGYAYIAKKYISDKKMPEISVSDYEFDLLCRVVMAEGGYTEPELGLRYMADGILNRVDSSRFPNTITGVLTQAHQFSCVSSGSIYRWTPTEQVIKICKEELQSHTNNKVMFWRTGHYHTGYTPIAKIGNHYYSGL